LRRVGKRARVLALADVDENRRRRVAGMFNVPHCFDGVESMLQQVPGIDAVAVCTPAQNHADAVIASLVAGKHVLVEKPLALTLDDADRIASEAGIHPRLRVMVGFNLRHHRLVQKARRMIADGCVGDVRMVQTVWSASIRNRMVLPPWRNRRELGGGVLNEIAVHHIDLLRYLLGREVEQVFVQTQHGEGDDESATLNLRLGGGVVASCLFSERSADANQIEIFGSKGRLAFSLYRFDSLRLAVPGHYGGRARSLAQSLCELPEAWPILRRGGDFIETYRQEWLEFLDAVERDQPAWATIEDGREALRVVLAGGASANAKTPVAIADAPRQHEPVPGVLESHAPDLHQDQPSLSAIISTHHQFASIQRTIRHLRAQSVHRRIELLVVCPTEQGLQLDPAEVCGFWGHRIIEVGQVMSTARNNAAGVRAASAPIVVFCEDHSFPEPGWAEALIAAHQGPYAAVGPAVRNANPRTAVSWADCVIGYGPWMDPVPPSEPSHLPGHNSSYKRDALLKYGDRLDEMLEAETILHWDLRARGQRLYLEPAARVAHTNFAQFGFWTKVQFHAGRTFASTRAQNWPLWKRLAFTCAAPLIPAVRLTRVWRHVWRVRRAHPLPLRVFPVLLWGLAWDGFGQLVGYGTGSGASSPTIANYEYERVRYITEEDRRDLAANQPASA
jgi:predicted dehydrogenase